MWKRVLFFRVMLCVATLLLAGMHWSRLAGTERTAVVLAHDIANYDDPLQLSDEWHQLIHSVDRGSIHDSCSTGSPQIALLCAWERACPISPSRRHGDWFLDFGAEIHPSSEFIGRFCGVAERVTVSSIPSWWIKSLRSARYSPNGLAWFKRVRKARGQLFEIGGADNGLEDWQLISHGFRLMDKSDELEFSNEKSVIWHLPKAALGETRIQQCEMIVIAANDDILVSCFVPGFGQRCPVVAVRRESELELWNQEVWMECSFEGGYSGPAIPMAFEIRFSQDTAVVYGCLPWSASLNSFDLRTGEVKVRMTTDCGVCPRRKSVSSN